MGTEPPKDTLILKLGALSRESGSWGPDDYDVLCNGKRVGRIMHTRYASRELPWFWSIDSFHIGQRPQPLCQGHEASKAAAMAAFRAAWDAEDRRRPRPKPPA